MGRVRLDRKVAMLSGRSRNPRAARQQPPRLQAPRTLLRPGAPDGTRRLQDLISIGPATLRDFQLLGIRSVEHLARQNPQQLHARLSRLTGQLADPCLLDIFCAAVAQARNPRLPAEQCRWWWWSSHRKKGQQT